LNVFVKHELPESAWGNRDSWFREVLEPWIMVLKSKTHSKRQKKKNFLKLFSFLFFLNVFVKHEPWECSRKQGFVIPRGPWALTFLIHKHIQKRQKKIF
jgi:hypothetical protein